MSDEADHTGLDAFEARLAVLAEKVRAGFPERARELVRAIDRLLVDELAARADIRRCAHKVHGTAGSHGFARLSEVAASLERLALEGAREDVALGARFLAEALEVEQREPARPALRIPEPAVAATTPSPALRGLRIAAVDDDASTSKLLGLTLSSVGGAETVVEEGGARLLERLRSERFDVVIIDAMMPEMNGLACLERIARESLHHEGTRYFVLSAATEQELAWSLPEALPVGWLRKPFRPRELVDALVAQLGR